MRVLELAPNQGSRQWGQQHGETFRPLVKEIAEIRIELSLQLGRFGGRQQLLEVAEHHLPLLKDWAPDLHQELLGIAEGADIDPSHVIVLNHYTDLRDLDPADIETSERLDERLTIENLGIEPPDECSAVWARTASGGVLGETWDMHGSAQPYVMMLRVPFQRDCPAAWLLSITGCVGMTGLNADGVGVAINNLHSTDARVGAVWPCIVRKALQQRTAKEAKLAIATAPVGSGHHYLVASSKEAYGIETSGTSRRVVFEGDDGAFVHTNHCLHPETRAHSKVPEASSTYERYERLEKGLEARPLKDRRDLWLRLGSHEGYPRSVCAHLTSPEQPHATRTCGAVAMDFQSVDLWATSGCVHHARPERFGFEDDGES